MTPLTVTELKDKLLQQCDETTILELLQISAEDLLEAFSERVEARYDYLVTQVGEEESSDEVDEV